MISQSTQISQKQDERLIRRYEGIEDEKVLISKKQQFSRNLKSILVSNEREKCV